LLIVLKKLSNPIEVLLVNQQDLVGESGMSDVAIWEQMKGMGQG
jgi:hypothetical protein